MANAANADGVGYKNTLPSIAGNLPKGWIAASISEAEFLSLPRPKERCRFSSLSRTTLVELLDRGVVKGVTLRQPGATRGKRLIVKESLASYLHGLVTSHAEVTAQEKGGAGS
jgi:hypothetical protein